MSQPSPETESKGRFVTRSGPLGFSGTSHGGTKNHGSFGIIYSAPDPASSHARSECHCDHHSVALAVGSAGAAFPHFRVSVLDSISISIPAHVSLASG